jgi:hypothetical protein
MTDNRRPHRTYIRLHYLMEIGDVLSDRNAAGILERLDHAKRIGESSRDRSHRASRARSTMNDDYHMTRGSIVANPHRTILVVAGQICRCDKTPSHLIPPCSNRRRIAGHIEHHGTVKIGSIHRHSSFAKAIKHLRRRKMKSIQIPI